MNPTKKLTFLFSFVVVIFLLLLGRLFQLQVVEGKSNRWLAETNRVQKLVIEAPRGLIYDRRGKVLADNKPVFFKDKSEVSRDEALIFQEEGRDSDLKIKLLRQYPNGQNFAHLLGYLGEVTQEQLIQEKLELQGYFLGSLIGQNGTEQEYEKLLKGHDGTELAEVDTNGKVIRRMGKVLPIPGKALTLAIDKQLQEKTIAALEGKKGAVIATDPRNGEVLIFYSSPSFDNNLFSERKDNTQLAKIITDEENLPLLNRVISGLYHPGSTYKIVTTITGLKEGKITASTLINDPGVIRIGDYSYSNWYFTSYGRTEGEINVIKAIARSTDTFFYKLGEMVGIERLNYWTNIFGLTNKYNIDLPGEIAGFMATPDWKMQNRQEQWFLGNTYHIAIGQGDLNLTPLGVNLMTQAVANEGEICTPRILKLEAENTPYTKNCWDLGVEEKHWQVVEKGMVQACEKGGTAYPFFTFEPKVACKTGTAETGKEEITHAWFTVYAPVNNPEIVLTVLVEEGGEGSSVAAPVAKKILTDYFNSQKQEEN